MKYGSNGGDPIWTYEYHGNVSGGDDTPVGLAVDGDGNVYYGGTTTIASHGTDFIVERLDAGTGDVDWTYTYHSSGNANDDAADLAIGPGNVLAITGTSVGTSEDESDIVTVVLDPDDGSVIASEWPVIMGQENDETEIARARFRPCI